MYRRQVEDRPPSDVSQIRIDSMMTTVYKGHPIHLSHLGGEVPFLEYVMRKAGKDLLRPIWECANLSMPNLWNKTGPGRVSQAKLRVAARGGGGKKNL